MATAELKTAKNLSEANNANLNDDIIIVIEETTKEEGIKTTSLSVADAGAIDTEPEYDKEPLSISTEVQKGYETTIELPRDILTAFILIRLNGTWDKLSKISRICVTFGFAFSFFAQSATFSLLIHETIDHFLDDFYLDLNGSDFVANLVAICALFMYLWKHVMANYNSVWFYVSLEEKKYLSQPMSKAKAKKLLSIGRFRLFLIGSFVLYAGFAMYSLVEIAVTEGITDKLEVAINVFFVLEIADWACELFVLGTGLLDDDEFDIVVVLENERGHAKSVEKNLKRVTTLLILSILLCYAITYFNITFGPPGDHL